VRSGETHCFEITAPLTICTYIITAHLGVGSQIACTVEVNRERLLALIDTGAGVSVMAPTDNTVFISDFNVHDRVNIVAANGLPMELLGGCSVFLGIGEMILEHVFYVVIGLPQYAVIIGNDLLGPLGALIDYPSQSMRLKDRSVIKWKYHGCETSSGESLYLGCEKSSCENCELSERKETGGTGDALYLEEVTQLLSLRHETVSSKGSEVNEYPEEKRTISKWPVIYDESCENRSKPRDLVAQVTVCLPPNTVQLVETYGDIPEGDGDWISVIYPHVELRYHCWVQGVLINKKSNDIQIGNFTDEPITIHRGMRLAELHKHQEASICSISPELFKPKSFDPSLFYINPDIDEEGRNELLKILKEYWDVFAFNNKELTCTDKVTHSIDTGDSPPIRQRLWTRYSQAEKQVITEQVREMLDCGIIERAYSPWASNVILVKKPNGKWRFCVDYRQLNQVTKFQAYPIPRITDILDSLSGSSIFSLLDCVSGFWQIAMNTTDGSNLKTAFITHDGTYVFKRMPFGGKNGPQEFQRLMDETFNDMKSEVGIYIDDITPHGKDIKQHNQRLKKILHRLREVHLKLMGPKCKFLLTEFRCLGYIVSGKGINIDPEKAKSISEMPAPKSLKQLRSFLGIINFYRKFIEKLAYKAAPLYDLTGAGKMSLWGPTHDQAFKDIKDLVLMAPTLHHFRDDLPVEVHTDACDYGVAAILVQIEERLTKTGKRRRVEIPIQYVSRTLRKPESKWGTPEKEMLAGMYALTEFRPYLALRPFVIRTDHIALIQLKQSKDPIKTRIARWGLKLQEFECEIIHRPGKYNLLADALSRNPYDKPLQTEDILDIPTFAIKIQKARVHTIAKRKTINCENSDENIILEPGILNTLGKTVDISECQYTDEYCEDIRLHLENKPSFIVVDGILCKREEKTQQLRVVVPLVLRGLLIDLYHSTVWSGHLGQTKTIQKLKARFYWPKMDEDICNYINKCLSCNFHKVPRCKKPGYLHPINPYKVVNKLKVMDFVSTDLLGPFPVSEKGNRMIIIVTDYASRYVIGGALPNGTAEEVASFIFDKVICVFGMIRILLSDNGTCFRSKIMSELAKAISFKHSFTTPYNPSCNGLTERFNKTLATMLATGITGPSFTTWDKNIAASIFAYNTSIQDTIKEVPYYLMFGRDPLLPPDLDLALPTASLVADSLVYRLKKAQESARKALEKRQIQQKEIFDNKREPITIRIGDIVLYEVPIRVKGQPDKLQPKYKGLYKVIASHSDLTYTIRHLTTSKVETVSGRKLKKYEDGNVQESMDISSEETPILNPEPTQVTSPVEDEIHPLDLNKEGINISPTPLPTPSSPESEELITPPEINDKISKTRSGRVIRPLQRFE